MTNNMPIKGDYFRKNGGHVNNPEYAIFIGKTWDDKFYIFHDTTGMNTIYYTEDIPLGWEKKGNSRLFSFILTRNIYGNTFFRKILKAILLCQ